MKIYLRSIKYLQEILLAAAIVTMMVLPIILVFRQDLVSSDVSKALYAVAHAFLFFVMMVRPLADIFTGTKWIRPLVILRKGTGVMSAAIVVSYIFAKLIIDPAAYLASIGTLQYWSMWNYAVLGHMADLSALILLATSNNLSKRLLGAWWKKIQKLSYVYFYGSALYVFLSYGDINLLIAMILVTTATFAAFVKNKKKAAQIQNTVAQAQNTI